VLKKLALAAVALAISAPAFADRDHRRHGHEKHRYHVKHHYHQVQRPVVHHYYHYRPAPQRVVVVHRPQPVYYQPQPVYYQPHPNGAALVVGAVLGAAIAHHVVTGSY
jgi:hypothetical protein